MDPTEAPAISAKTVGTHRAPTERKLAHRAWISCVLVHSSEEGRPVLGPGGIRYLGHVFVIGKHRPALFPPGAVALLVPTGGFANAPANLVLSQDDPASGEVARAVSTSGDDADEGGAATAGRRQSRHRNRRSPPDEVAAFDDLIGRHGGLGGPRAAPFLLYPAALPLDEAASTVGSAALHARLKAWVVGGEVEPEDHERRMERGDRVTRVAVADRQVKGDGVWARRSPR